MNNIIRIAIKDKQYLEYLKDIEIDKSYYIQINKLKSVTDLHLSPTYVTLIYVLSHIGNVSEYVLSELLCINQTTITRIRNNITYINITKHINLEDYKNICDSNFKIIKKYNILSVKEKKSIKSILKTNSKTLNQITKKFNVSRSTVRIISKKYNINRNSKYNPLKLTKNEILAIFDECYNGDSLTIIAKRHNVDRKTVYNIKKGKTHKAILEENRMNQLLLYK